MLLDVQRRNSLKSFFRLRKHRHIEPGIPWLLGLFPAALCLERFVLVPAQGLWQSFERAQPVVQVGDPSIRPPYDLHAQRRCKSWELDGE
jgi:hypothetical protein